MSLTLALDLFRGGHFEAAIEEIWEASPSPPIPPEAYELLSKCEVLRDLEEALRRMRPLVGIGSTYKKQVNQLVHTLTSKIGEDWLQDREDEAVLHLVRNGLLLVEELKNRSDYPAMRQWLKTLNEALAWHPQVHRTYQEYEEELKAVTISDHWTGSHITENYATAIINIKRQFERYDKICRWNPSDSRAREHRAESLQQYRELTSRARREVQSLKEKANRAIECGKYREARNALNDILLLSGVNDTRYMEDLENDEAVILLSVLDLRYVKARLRQARSLAKIASKANELLDEAEAKIAELDFESAQSIVTKVQRMELRGPNLTPEQIGALARWRQGRSKEGDDVLYAKASQLKQQSIVARLEDLGCSINSAWRLYELAKGDQDNQEFEAAKQRLRTLRIGWPMCSPGLDEHLEQLEVCEAKAKFDAGRLKQAQYLLNRARESSDPKDFEVVDRYVMETRYETEKGRQIVLDWYLHEVIGKSPTGNISNTSDLHNFPASLYRTIVERFNLDELRILVMQLNDVLPEGVYLDYENLAGSTKMRRAQELVSWCLRRSVLQLLGDTVLDMRPEVADYY